MREKQIQQDIRIAIGKHPERVVLWRNNVGYAEHVSPSGQVSSTVYGLCPGSSDLIGIRRLIVGGEALGQFVALEVKCPGEYPTSEQRRFLELVRRLGGVAEVVRTPEEAVQILL